MRIIQLIDSLEAGGAERIAVNYANSLSGQIAFSALVATRSEGVLKEELKKEVPYLFLNRKRRIDIGAVLRLKQFVKVHDVSIVHAHGTSFFMAVLLKLVAFKVKVVWHDHNGNRSNQTRNENKVLHVCSLFFSYVFTVNKELESWSIDNLLTKKVLYVPNFTVVDNTAKTQTILKGNDGRRIVCLSNLRHPKNHLFLITAFWKSNVASRGWTLHLVGRDGQDHYSEAVKSLIIDYKLEQSVFIYGSRTDVYSILGQATLGVLASSYEGFPVTLLEYGLSGLAVISTNVGYCKEIIHHEHNGLLIDPNTISDLVEGFVKMESDVLRRKLGAQLYDDVSTTYSAKKVIASVVSYYNSIL